MTEMISYCGLVCSTCPIYLATRAVDREQQAKMRAEIARLCNENYGTTYTPADVNDCDGCQAQSGRLFSGCKDCRIRPCAQTRRLRHCAECPEYICEKLKEMLAAEPGAKERLDSLRAL